jgi:anti-anti-sigma factor
MALPNTSDGTTVEAGVKVSSGSGHSGVTAQSGPLAAVVTLPAEIDISNDALIEDELTSALGDGLAVLVADGSRTTFCALAGMSALTRAHRQAVAAGAQLRVVTSPAVRRILFLTGADRVLDTYPSLADALAGRHAPSVT